MKFSIITPTYNRAHTIKRAIDSMRNQTYDNWEMIIIDDGSTDNTEEIVKNIQQKDNRIKYIKAKQNGGVGKARNLGFKNISNDTDWIGFLDSDDILVEDALEMMVKKIKEYPNIKHFAFSTRYENAKSGCKIPHDNYIGGYESVLGKNSEVEGEFNTLLHKSIIDDGFRFEESVNGYEWIAWLRLAKSGVKILYTTTTTTRIYITDGESLIRTSNKSKRFYENSKKGLEIILNEFGEDLKIVNKKKYALYLYTLANTNIKLGNKKNGLMQTLKAIKYDFFNLRLVRNVLNAILY